MHYCEGLRDFLREYVDAPIMIRDDLSIDILGYHEPIGPDHPIDVKFIFCPFCDKDLRISNYK